MINQKEPAWTSICKEIVEHLGGRIWLESEVGKGSTFHLHYPLRKQSLRKTITP
ncbi:MAG: hypothetical protein IPP73_10065 [Chitinophagaceae bacterium]|nr:hypothetical protein [Chitinophagaceae bacterium]